MGSHGTIQPFFRLLLLGCVAFSLPRTEVQSWFLHAQMGLADPMTLSSRLRGQRDCMG